MFQMKNDASLSNLHAGSNKNSKPSITRIRGVMSAHPTNLSLIETRQSPKILTGKYRDDSGYYNGAKIAFSQLDVPIGKMAKGTKLPAQFERKEIEKIFNKTINTGFFKPQGKTNSPLLSEEEKNNNLNNGGELKPSPSFYNIDSIKARKMSAENYTSNPNNVNNNNQESNIIPTVNSGNKNLNIENNNSSILPEAKASINMNNTTYDKWMPKNYLEFERLVKTAHSNRGKDLYTSVGPSLPYVSVKEIKKKQQESDIFFTRKSRNIMENFDKVRESHNKSKGMDYQDSDIFMMKNNPLALQKNAEKYLDAAKKSQVYSSSSRSNSEWQPKNAYASLLNHSSTNYNLLNPEAKNTSRTKGQILNESHTGNSFNPTFKQKSLCEFIDLTRVGVPNPNKEFLSAFNKSKNGFGRESNLCSAYLDLHKMYRGISERPFVKKIV
jgi:hypothetical protein